MPHNPPIKQNKAETQLLLCIERFPFVSDENFYTLSVVFVVSTNLFLAFPWLCYLQARASDDEKTVNKTRLFSAYIERNISPEPNIYSRCLGVCESMASVFFGDDGENHLILFMIAPSLHTLQGVIELRYF